MTKIRQRRPTKVAKATVKFFDKIWDLLEQLKSHFNDKDMPGQADGVENLQNALNDLADSLTTELVEPPPGPTGGPSRSVLMTGFYE